MFHICGCRYSSSSKNTVQATVGYSTRRIYMVVQFQNLIVTRAGSGLLYFFKHLHPAIYAEVISVFQDHHTELKLNRINSIYHSIIRFQLCLMISIGGRRYYNSIVGFSHASSYNSTVNSTVNMKGIVLILDTFI